MPTMANSYWPLFDLRITTPRLELRLPTDDELNSFVAVSDKCGYERNGETRFLMGGTEPVRIIRFRMDAERWNAHRRDDVEVAGFEACGDLF